MGPAIPLAIALLHNAVVPSAGTAADAHESSSTSSVAPVACGEGIEDYLACHSEYPTGCNANGKYDAYLNTFNNQVEWNDSQLQGWLTTPDEIAQLENKLPVGLGKTNHGDNLDQLRVLGEGKIYGVVGYLYGVKAEGKESSNCQLDAGEDNENVDFHIYIGFDPVIAAKIRHKTTTPTDRTQINPQSMIVEMTPHYRARSHPEWSLNALRNEVGKRVRITGQLMVDNEHYVKSQDCGHKDHTAACWRVTVWELHPVTRFEYCNDDSCTQDSTDWLPLGGQDGGTDGGGVSGPNSGATPAVPLGTARRPQKPTRTSVPRSNLNSRP
jgi:hypothetical protein